MRRPTPRCVLLGQMRCIEALGEWSHLHSLSESCRSRVGSDTRQRMARMASAAAWGKGEWASVEQSVGLLSRDSQVTPVTLVTHL